MFNHFSDFSRFLCSGCIQRRAEEFSAEADVYGENYESVVLFGIYVPYATEEMFEEIVTPGKLEFIVNYGTDNEEVVVTGDNVLSASVEKINYGEGIIDFGVNIKFDETGKEQFAEATENHLGENIAIVFDKNLINNPTVESPITEGVAVINGLNSYEEASNLAMKIDSGAIKYTLIAINN